MKLDKWITAGTAAVLAFLLSFGAAGCMITAFSLPLANYPMVLLAWGASALFCSAAFSWKRGGIPVLLLAALLAGYLGRRGVFLQQLLQLLYRVTHVYDRAYGWGVFKLVDTSWNAGFADWPMGVLGAAIAMVTAWTVCRGKSPDIAISLALLPLFSCLVVTDTVPSLGSLFALIFVLALLLLSTHVRKSNPHRGNRLTLLAALPTALALGALFLAFPQECYVNQSAEIRDSILTWFQELPERLETTVPEVTISIQGSEPEHIDLSTMGRRIESTAPVMDVSADVGGALYLRGQDYDGYDGINWTASDHRVEDFSFEGIGLGSVTVQTRSQMEYLYLPYYPEDGYSLIGGKLDNLRLYTEYTFTRTGLPDNWRELAAADSGSAAGTEVSADYLALPEDTRAEAEALLESVLQGGTITEKAETIASFVRNSASYNLNPSRMPSSREDFALWFLEESETGYCVHFATAAVVLLRAAGIEARYVSGYMVRVRAGETATVTGENAHAWAEYYEPALHTWLVLEATPGNQSEPLGTPAETQATAPSTQPTEETIAATAAHTQETETPTQPAVSTQPPTEPAEPAEAARTYSFGWLSALWKLLLIAAVAAASTEGQRKLRLRLRRRRQRTGAPNAQALARWQESELLAELLKEPPSPELEALAQKAKFSQHTLTPEELAQFESYLRAAKKRLRQKPWYLRLVHQYIFAIY